MIPFNNRFHGHSSLRYVYKNGQTVRSHLATIKVIKNKNRKKTRVAVVISKKILKSAVRRNLVRRRIYEIIRNDLPRFDDVYDIAIIISSGEILSTPFEELSDQINSLLNQVGVRKIAKHDFAKTD